MLKNKSRLRAIVVFVGKIALFYVILMLLVYFFGYLGHGQSNFIYNEF
ncbi:teichoic acid D-Ala incorporation-associated protein DltX [Streptococcus equi]|uniref:Teichoic acid D-Ala incorporation-associated protein DltX n=1 Tax=Streptococcus equi subsp. ruminatorum TaxID=254358 RepID=A0A6M1KLF5_9STRE|nr:teichoic acid D-Ala incorporation-associated protein DltX [Streptococcus equi]NGL83300.1 teichoic acid D-Ala incorporation-associated protein DltX [Streptococcus equi subsp. ruminatorum]